MYATRIPAITQNKLNIGPYTTKEQMNAGIPRPVQWKADNYNHLFEQPTQFYAIIFALVYLEANDSLTVNLAWGYVGVRVAHSLVQAISNPVRTLKVTSFWRRLLANTFIVTLDYGSVLHICVELVRVARFDG